jgi:transposase InsO family protein
VRDYFYDAIDVTVKFALTLNYNRLTIRNVKDFYRRVKNVYPLTIESWQSDNGPENLGGSDDELKRNGIPHYFSDPRCSKIKAYVERYNRTIQEESIDNNLGIIYDKPLFHQRLADYLIFYSTQRPNKSLQLKSPVDYLIEKGGMSQKSSTYTGC